MDVLDKIKEILDEQEQERERLIKEIREVEAWTRKAINHLINGKISEAKSLIKKSEEKLRKLHRTKYKLLYYSGITHNAQQELCEAKILLAIIERSELPEVDFEILLPTAYLNGLGDVVGELKRLMLDSMRRDDAKAAQYYFAQMQAIYDRISELRYPEAMAPGLRRKTDIARRIVESSREMLTQYLLDRNLKETLKEAVESLK